MKKKLTSNPISEIDLLSKPETWHYSHKDQLDYISDDRWRKKVINTLLLWAEKESHMTLGRFLFTYKIPRATFYKAAKKYDDLKEVHTEVMSILGLRRQEGALKKKLSETMVLKDLHVYLPEWHEVNEYHKKLKQDEAIAVAERLAAKPIIGDPYANLRKEEEEITKRIFEKVKAKLSEEEIAAMQAEAIKEYKAVKGE